MIHRRVRLLLISALTVGAASAEPAADALDQTSRELRDLSGGRTAPALREPVPADAPLPVGAAPVQPAAPRLSPEQRQALRRQREKEKNWLVDAMAGTTGGSARPVASIEQMIAEARDVNQPASGRADASDLQAAAPAVRNPLADFMAGWMTPSDYQLLQAADPAPGPTVPRSVPPAGQPTPIMPSGGALTGANPFLRNVADLDPPSGKPTGAPTAAQLPLVPLPSAVSPSEPSPLGPPQADAATPAPADRPQWQPSGRQDDKYFPQLKRF